MLMLPRIHMIMFCMLIFTGCSSLPEDIKHSQEPLSTQPVTSLSKLTNSYLAEQQDQGSSAIIVQDTGWSALSQRLSLVETAEHSIDIQYYIWNSDVSGQYLASRLIAAADRGVNVRIMLDDINLNEREDLLTTIDSHPHIEIRIFNPIPSRGFAKWFNVLGDFSRLNRRMHNKSFTVDGVASVVGGRNIGDEYFDLSNDINFRDRDALVIGLVVNDIHTSFTKYWNSRWSYPIKLLGGEASPEPLLLNDIVIPHYKHYPALPEGKKIAHTFLNNLMPDMTYVNARFISDRPVPLDESNTSEPKITARFLAELAEQSEQEIILESAYLIFDDHQLASLNALANKGVQIKALTNSMASNDLITNHSGYAGRRKDMLEKGIQLFELMPETTLCNESIKDLSKCAPTTPYGLHAKSIVFDRKLSVIGSFNFNLRSTYLNTESILVIDDNNIAESLADDIEKAMSDDNSWRLDLLNNELRWHSGMKTWEKEPESNLSERIKSRFLQLLPIEKYL